MTVTADPASLLERVRELEQLNQLAQALSSTLSVEESLDTIVRSCLTLCSAERAAVVLFDNGTKKPETLVRCANTAADGIDHMINDLVAGWVQRHKEPLVTNDVLLEFRFQEPSARIRRLGPALAVPLMDQGTVFGMINLINSRDGNSFSSNHLRVAGIISTIAAQYIHRAEVHEFQSEHIQQLKSTLTRERGVHSILGNSREIKAVIETIGLVAPSSANVLLIGETGTGKELVAKAIHYEGQRADKPFIAVNCAAIPHDLFESELFGHVRGAFTGATDARAGRFELANGGTLFLDEISEMPPALQPKLLRVLEEKKFQRIGSSDQITVDVRVIAASSKDLARASQAGEFREALFHRLNVVPITLPTLRERVEDIPLLAEAFLGEISEGSKRFTAEALALLKTFEWKGNVRELRNVVERISILAREREVGTSSVRLFSFGADAGITPRLTSAFREMLHVSDRETNIPDRVEKELIQLALRECSENVSQAARLLGIDRMALQRRIEKFELNT
ncbi:MAG: sigma 54-interacting transcriptional regulator [Ignavibacteriales bacterium]|nr:sigma 54-interacting transcriptional regulator [Ignavibacteriales bacterium]